MKKTENKYLTNQVLLTVLWDQLPTFTRDEWTIMMKILGQHQSKIMELVQSHSPRIHDWIQEKHQQLEKEKTDKQVEKLKKKLPDQK